MCILIGFGIGLFLIVLGGLFLYLNMKNESSFIKFISFFSIEGGAFVLGLLIILLSILEVLGIVQGSCKSDLLN